IPGLISSYSQTNSQCPAPSYLRQVPDVSASADPQHGYVIYYNGSWNAVFGGTSLAAPLWAAVAPLIDASPFCSGYGAGTPGTLPQGLYSIAASSYYANAFNDVTSGNNDYTPSGYTGGLYPATPGYDMATGLGTPAVMDYSAGTPSYFIPGLAALQCYTYRSTSYADTITSVTPSTGSESTPTSVTIAGTGFLPIAGADMLTVGTTQVAASCSSTTACTAVIPASHVVEKVDLRMTVESLAESAVTSADQFSWTGPYPNPPTNLQAVPGAGQATVSWTPPVYQGTTAITSYTVSGSDLTTNSSITPVAVNGSPPPTQAVISGLTNGDRYSFTAAATNQSGTGAQSAPVDLLAPSQYAPLPPARICDTRPTSESGAPADQCTGHTLGPGSVITVQVTGLGGVPSSATAVVANITVTNTSAPSYLTVWPAGGTRPLASNLNWGAGQTVANLVTVPVSAGGAIQVYNANGQADVVVDVSGYYGPTGLSGATLGFTSLPPARICDTRPTSESGAAADQCTGKTLRPGGTITVLVTGLGGVPSSATAVVANVTVTNTTAASYLTVWPAGGTRPLASNLNWGAGQTRPNRIVIPLSSNGQIELYNAVGQADVVVDVNGYYSSSSPGLYEPINPVRICDTRPTSESGAPADQCTGETLQTGSVLPIQVAGLASVPANAGAMVANVTVTNTGDPSYLTVYPGPTRPLASDLNWVSGDTVPNLVVAGLYGGGLDLFNATGPVDVVVDVEGWFT
ncbi:MAG TPA: fibronectin type III domain-containing protein, partial [Candidatus Dormibacteraeota bacterium]|nr:fibronectin type III domain-containing protein [Candidatus Dormibacteraeota bacterium]